MHEMTLLSLLSVLQKKGYCVQDGSPPVLEAFGDPWYAREKPHLHYPVHFHPNLLVARGEQESPFYMKLALSWPQDPDEQAIKRMEHGSCPSC